MEQNKVKVQLEGKRGKGMYYPIEMVQYLCRHGEKSAIYLAQEYNDYGKLSYTKDGYKNYFGICRADLLKESKKMIVFNESVCKQLASIDYANLKTEKAFALRGYKFGGLIFVDSVVFQTSDKNEHESAVKMTAGFKTRHAMWSKIKYSKKGKPFVFFGHTHPRTQALHPHGEITENHLSLVDLVELRNPQEVVNVFEERKTFKSIVIENLVKGVEIGICMINALGDITAVVANDDWDLETIKDIKFLHKNMFKKIDQFSYNGTHPFGVFRDSKNYNLPVDEDMWEIVDEFEKLRGPEPRITKNNHEKQTSLEDK